MTEIRKRSIEYWVGYAIAILIMFSLVGGGGVLIVAGGQAIIGAPDMVIGAAMYGMGWAVLSCYFGLATYCYSCKDKKRIDKLEKEISEIRGRIG